MSGNPLRRSFGSFDYLHHPDKCGFQDKGLGAFVFLCGFFQLAFEKCWKSYDQSGALFCFLHNPTRIERTIAKFDIGSDITFENKFRRNDTIFEMNDMDIENQILEYLLKHGVVRTPKLIEDIMKQHEEVRGYSRKTIYRHVEQLIKKKKVTKLSNKDYTSFGIPESNNRVTYIVLTTTASRKDHVDRVLNLLKSKNIDEVKSAIDEIDRYKDKYLLNPAQLDRIVDALSPNLEISHIAISVLYLYILKKDIKPISTENMLKRLRELCDDCLSEDSSNAKNIRAMAIRILGLYHDDWIVKQLQKDAKSFDPPSQLLNYYKSKYTARIIEAHRTTLFSFSQSLKKQQKNDVASVIDEIRNYATENEDAPLDYQDLFEAINGGKR